MYATITTTTKTRCRSRIYRVYYHSVLAVSEQFYFRRLQQQQQQRQQHEKEEESYHHHYYYHRNNKQLRYYHELSYTKHGNPADVVSYHCHGNHKDDDNGIQSFLVNDQYQQQSQNQFKTTTHVLVQMIAVPFNPADINSIQGRYPSPYNIENDTIMYNNTYNYSTYFPNHTVIGSEGWGRIIDVRQPSNNNTNNTNNTNNKNTNVQIGNYVAIGLSGLGTMRSYMWVPVQAVIPITRGQELYNYCIGTSTDTNNDTNTDTDMDHDCSTNDTNNNHKNKMTNNNITIQDKLASVSTLFQLGGTAYRILHDFEQLQQYESGSNTTIIIQNAGTSGVAFMVTQLACELYNNNNTHTANSNKVYTVSLIRRKNRTDNEYNTICQHLINVGKASIVIAEDDDNFSINTVREMIQQVLSRDSNTTTTTSSIGAALGINAVGGESASIVLKLLNPNKTLVTYGGMSMKPISINTSQFIFNNIQAVGYWHSKWMYENSILLLKENNNTTNNNSRIDQRHCMINLLVDLLLDKKIVSTPTKGFHLNQFHEAIRYEKNQQLQQEEQLSLDDDTTGSKVSNNIIRHKIGFCL